MFARLSLSTLLSLVLASTAWSQAMCPAGGAGWAPVSHQDVTVTPATAVQIDLSTYPHAATNLGMALVTVEDASIRFRFDGAPTADAGHELAPGVHFFICGRALMEGFQAIRVSQGAANAVLRISLFRAL